MTTREAIASKNAEEEDFFGRITPNIINIVLSDKTGNKLLY